MQREFWLVGLIGLAIALPACQRNTTSQAPPQSTPAVATVTATASPVPAAAAPPSPAALVPLVPNTTPADSVSRALPPGRLPVPLLPPTGTTERSPQLPATRRDPFAPVATEVEIIPTTPAPAVPTRPAVPAASGRPAASTTPALPTGALPTTPTTVAVPRVPVASVPVATAPAPAPIPVARTIQISGVVQIGDRTHIIVQVPQEGGSRTVAAGEYLANGTVLVKRVIVAPNQEPRVILVQDGVEIVRTVGDRSA